MNPLLARIRLSTGLVLFTYVLTHNLNHALGLISLDAMEWGRGPFLAFWRFPLIEPLFMLSALAHFLLGVRSIFLRRSLMMPFWEAAQILLGLAIPPLLTLHFLGTVATHYVFGVGDAYDEVVLVLVSKPSYTVLQTAAVLVTWTHGCIGLGYWLRLKSWYPQARPYLFSLALLIPVLALLGFAEAGREVLRLAQLPGWFDQRVGSINWWSAAICRVPHRWPASTTG
jgi:adenylate cyclase